MTTNQEAKPWKAGLQAVIGAVVATLAVRWVGLALVDVPAEFPPLDGSAPTIFLTTVFTIAAVGVFGLVRRRSQRPARTFRLIALVALILSFLPDLWLLSDGAAGAFPGATPSGVAILMLMHVAAAIVIVWVLTGGAAREGGDRLVS